MVSTRNHPSSFPPPDISPTKALTRSPRSNRKGSWTHTPSTITLLWLLASLPVVCWDTAYVMLRPHSMPNGSLHAPIFTPYALYGQIDYIYGEKAYKEHNGFTAAQGSLNIVETVGGLWLAFPSYMIYEFAGDILHGLAIASGDRSSKPARAATPTKDE
ncbi:MAG: hypothetical protein Q9161_004437 [Pseudevernia consocians]